MDRVPMSTLSRLGRVLVQGLGKLSTNAIASTGLRDNFHQATKKSLSLHFQRHLASEASPSTPRMTDLSGLGPKRFYENVSTREHIDNGRTEHVIVLDGKTVKTPRGGILATPTKGLSTAVAAEWDAQEGRIRPSSMPLTTLVTTARDIVPNTRGRIVDSVLRYLHTDAVCLRPDTPKELVEAQDKACAPVLNQLRESGVRLVITRGQLSAEQSNEVVEVVRHCVEGLDNYSLAALDAASGSVKSVAIGLALLKRLDVDSAIDAGRAEERWQSKVWGMVEGGHDVDEADLEVRLRASDMIFRFVEQEPGAFRDLVDV